MASIYSLKPGFQLLLQPVVDKLAKHGVKPNTVTVGALVLSVASGLAIALQPEANWPLLILPLTLLMRMALNALDGMLARQYRLETRLGALLNELGDVLADIALYLPFALVPGLPAAGIVGLCLLASMAEMTGVMAALTTGRRSYAGPMGKSDRAFVIAVLAVLLGSGISPGVWSSGLLTVVNLLVLVTIINRARDACQAEQWDRQRNRPGIHSRGSHVLYKD